MGTVVNGKAAIREVVRRKRAELDGGWIAEKSGAIAGHLFGLDVFRDADLVGCYMAIDGEVQTEGVIEKCFKESKKICIPALDVAVGSYRMALLDPDCEMKAGAYGIKEPVDPDWIADEKIGLVLVPGLGFDKSGGRAGHGGGHYDRMLLQVGDAVKAALAFDFQLFERVPVAEHDILMDLIITEKGVNRRGDDE